MYGSHIAHGNLWLPDGRPMMYAPSDGRGLFGPQAHHDKGKEERDRPHLPPSGLGSRTSIKNRFQRTWQEAVGEVMNPMLIKLID